MNKKYEQSLEKRKKDDKQAKGEMSITQLGSNLRLRNKSGSSRCLALAHQIIRPKSSNNFLISFILFPQFTHL